MTAASGDGELTGYFRSLSNWGRWGPDDQRGTLNFIDDMKRASAAALVEQGLTVSCSRVVAPGPAGSGVLHFMTASGEAAPGLGAGGAADWFGMPVHGPTTHVDSLAHVFWEGRVYNGFSAARITTATGAGVGSVELLADGIVSRGVLLDIPLAQGRAWLEPGEPIGPDDLDACAEAESIAFSPGDVLLVRTGRDRHLKADPVVGASDDAPGLHAGCLPWLHQRSVAVLGSDAANDVLPSGYAGVELPVHTVGMVAMGLWLIDKLWLEDLAAQCARTRRWDFFFLAAPLRLKRATGSPVNPIAMF
jgi:kynurenine formamidase